ncbi:MAG: SET domain-containing protein [Burkholderiaceae bacterium]|nr:SET domain-containing protein [Burkholderiaceae bacterium]
MPLPMHFTIRHSSIDGKGVFATGPIATGTMIAPYKGRRVLGDRTARAEQIAGAHTMSFDLPDGTTLDGRLAFNPVRFLNHRCEPNCSAYYAHGHLRIYAIADIAPGEELTLDYQLSRPQPWRSGLSRRFRCRCGSGQCRGSLLAA